MKRFIYNQNDYANLAYNKPNGEKKTIASSGCGVVSSCIAVNSIVGKELYTVKQMRDLSLNCGARTNNGTAVNVLLNAIVKKVVGLSYSTTSDEDKLIKHLKNGGVAIANQGSSYNVFSTAGHFVVCVAMSGDNIEVIDAQMYSGKYDRSPRPKRIVKKTANGCIVSKTEISKATADRSPSYYLISFTNSNNLNKPSVKVGDKIEFTKIRKCYKNYGAKSDIYKISELTAFVCDEQAKRKAGTKQTVTAIKTLGNGNIWIEYEINNNKVYSCIFEKSIDTKYIK